MARILIFGDSVAWGAWDEEGGGWAERLKTFMYENADSDIYQAVYNLGVSGDSSKDLIERFEFETKQRLKEEDELVIIFAIGTNDSWFFNLEKQNNISPEKFEKNLEKLIRLSRKYSSRIIFLGLAPVDDSKTSPVPWYPEISYKNEYARKYNKIIKSVCKKKKVHFVDIFEDWEHKDYKALLDDGLHPNSEGHRHIFDKVRSFLIESKII